MPRILANLMLQLTELLLTELLLTVLLLTACLLPQAVQAQDLFPGSGGWISAAILVAVMLLPAALFAWLFLKQRFSRLELQNHHQQDQNALEILQKQLHQAQDLIGQLRHSEQLLQFAMKGSGDGVWDWDNSTGQVLYNDRYRAMLGYLDEQEFPNEVTSWRALVHPDDCAQVASGIKRYFSCIRPPGSPGEDPIYLSQYRMRCKDGSWKWFISRGTVIKRDSEGKPLRMTGTLSDITAQKKAEELQLQTLFEASPDVMLLVYKSGKIHYANARTTQLFGYTSQELSALNIDALVPSALRNHHQQLRQHYFEQTQTNPQAMAAYRQISAQRKDGSEFAIEVSLCPINMANQTLVIVTLRDITERKRNENALRQSEERLHEIIDALPVSIYIKNAQSQYILMNRACEVQIGIPFPELQGTTGKRFFSTEQLSAFIASDQKAFAGRRMIEFEETTWNFALEENRFVRTFKKPIFDAAGEPNYLIGVSIDITENRRAERALIELNEHLEERVALRTHELDQAKQIAEEASAAKGKFLANMSHEIRTPMNGVIGMAYLALKTSLTPKQRDYLEKIHAAGEHLLGIIDDILDFSKIEAGKLEIEAVDFSIDKIMRNLHNLVAAKAEGRGLALIYNIAPDVPQYLRGDPLRLGQILINFTNNAIKFSENGSIAIRVSRQQAGDPCAIRFEVIDQGIGISADNLAKLFQSFQQADASTTRQYGGTGLGLVICKQLVELMKGSIGVESQPGSGSTFWFVLPLGLACAPGESTEVGSGHESCSLQGMHILLAEDNAFNQQIAIELLEQQGAVVCLANNGREALDLLQKTGFDCVLMDVQMPVLDGLAATRLLRQQTQFAALPVIAMTANASNDDRILCLKAGMNDFVSKPIQPDLLFTTLRKWVKPATSQAHAALPPAPTGVAVSAGSAIDLQVLANLIGNNPEKIRKFAEKFYTNAETGLNELDSACQAGDLATIGGIGHRLKSGARAVGASEFAALCETLEQSSQHANLATAQQISRQLRQNLLQIHKIIHNA